MENKDIVSRINNFLTELPADDPTFEVTTYGNVTTIKWEEYEHPPIILRGLSTQGIEKELKIFANDVRFEKANGKSRQRRPLTEKQKERIRNGTQLAMTKIKEERRKNGFYDK